MGLLIDQSTYFAKFIRSKFVMQIVGQLNYFFKYCGMQILIFILLVFIGSHVIT